MISKRRILAAILASAILVCGIPNVTKAIEYNSATSGNSSTGGNTSSSGNTATSGNTSSSGNIASDGNISSSGNVQEKGKPEIKIHINDIIIKDELKEKEFIDLDKLEHNPEFKVTVEDDKSSIAKTLIKVNDNEKVNIVYDVENQEKSKEYNVKLYKNEIKDDKYIISVISVNVNGVETTEDKIIYVDNKEPEIYNNVEIENFEKKEGNYIFANKLRVSFETKADIDENISSIKSAELYLSDTNNDDDIKENKNVILKYNDISNMSTSLTEFDYEMEEKTYYSGYLCAQIKNICGKESNILLSENKFVLDNENPTCSLKINNNDYNLINDKKWIKAEAVDSCEYTYTINDDGSGIKEYSIEVNGNKVEEKSENINEKTEEGFNKNITGSFSLKDFETVNGKYEIVIEATDNAGNKSEVSDDNNDIIYVDNTAPDINGTVNFDNITKEDNIYMFSNKDITISFDVKDDGVSSGINKVEIYNSDNFINQADAENDVIEKNLNEDCKIGEANIDNGKVLYTISVPNSNTDAYEKYVYAKISDNTGNYRFVTLSDKKLMLEKNIPVVSVEKINLNKIDENILNNLIGKNIVGYKITITDTESGIENYSVSIEEKNINLGDNVEKDMDKDNKLIRKVSFNISTLSVIDNPYITPYNINVIAKDNAGNEVNELKNNEIGNDKEAPYIVSDSEKKAIFNDQNNTEIKQIGNAMFTNGDVNIEFFVKDNISGVKNIEIYALDKTLNNYKGNEIENYKISSNNVKLNDNGQVIVNINSKEETFKKYIYAKLTDNANNSNYELLSNNLLIIEKSAPDVNKLYPNNKSDEYNDKSGKWIKGKVIYNYFIEDKDSGIESYNIYVQYKNNDANEVMIKENGTYDFTNNIVNEVSGTFELTPASNESGEYTIIIKTRDNAGNTNQEKVYKYVVNADLNKPEVIISENNKPIFENVSETIINGEMFANNSVNVKFSVQDVAPSSGIKNAEVYAVENKLDDLTEEISNMKKLDEINLSNGKVTFTVSDTNNKCIYFYAKVFDNVGNDSGYVLLSEKGLIIDTNESEVTNIEGNEAYIEPDGKRWIKEATEYEYSIEDKESGIKSYVIKVNGQIVADSKNISEYDFKNDMIISVTGKFTLEPKKIKSEDGKYVIKIYVYDNAGNKVENKIIHTVYYDENVPENIEIKGNIAYTEPSGERWIKEATEYEYSIEDKESGIKSYVIKVNEQTVTDSKNISEYDFKNSKITMATGKFTLDPKKIKSEDGKYIIKIYVYDNVGNKVENQDIYTVFYDGKIPDIVKLKTEPQYLDTNSNKKWNNGEVNYNYSYELVDEESGIKSYSIKVNDKVISNNGYKELEEYDFKNKKETVVKGEFKFDPKSINTKDGSYKVVISVIDNTGNNSTKTDIIYKDSTKPTVTKFSMQADKYVEGNALPVEDDKYGYYFKQSTKVTVTLSDEGASSGISKAAYFLCKNDEEPSKAIKKVKYIEKPGNKITITIPEAFKGQIYVAAIDNVGNGNLSDINSYKKPDAIIIDDNRNDKDVITINRPKTTYRDNSGLDLYNKDIPVAFNIKDITSGIRSIEWNVVSANDVENNYSGRIDIDNSGKITGDNYNIISTDKNLVTSISKVIAVKNNDNRITITIKVEDRAGNISYAKDSFSIDKTAPEINISYDNNTSDAVNRKLFKADRKATISVKERNFNPKDVVINIKNTDGAIPAISDWKMIGGTGNGDNTTYTTTISYTNDGDYTFSMEYKDNASNVSYINFASTTVEPTEFTIDKTRPALSVQYNNNSAMNGNYYLDQRVATFTIVEHNFDASRFELSVSKNNTVLNKNINWTNNGDTHTASIIFDEEAVYNVKANYTDMAGNTIESVYSSEFYVDKKAPEVIISGISNEKAYKDNIIGFVISSADTYFEDMSLSLELLNKDGSTTTLVSNNYEKSNVHIDYQNIENGKKLSVENLESDGIYRLMCRATDKAGRVTENNALFSINRNGPAYYIDDELTLSIKDKYLSAPQDIIFNEINVNELESDTIKVTVYRGNTIWDLTEGKDYTVEKIEGLDKWCKYKYIISKDNFKENGIYHVTIASKDLVENDAISEKFSFVIDNESPVCTIFELKDGNVYVADSKDVRFKVSDNIEMESVIVLLNGKEILKLSGTDIKKNISEDGTLKVTIPSSNNEQNLMIKCTDKSGNESETVIKKFYITTNLWIRFINNRILVTGLACAVVIITATIIFIIVKKNRNNDKRKA